MERNLNPPWVKIPESTRTSKEIFNIDSDQLDALLEEDLIQNNPPAKEIKTQNTSKSNVTSKKKPTTNSEEWDALLIEDLIKKYELETKFVPQPKKRKMKKSARQRNYKKTPKEKIKKNSDEFDDFFIEDLIKREENRYQLENQKTAKETVIETPSPKKQNVTEPKKKKININEYDGIFIEDLIKKYELQKELNSSLNNKKVTKLKNLTTFSGNELFVRRLGSKILITLDAEELNLLGKKFRPVFCGKLVVVANGYIRLNSVIIKLPDEQIWKHPTPLSFPINKISSFVEYDCKTTLSTSDFRDMEVQR